MQTITNYCLRFNFCFDYFDLVGDLCLFLVSVMVEYLPPAPTARGPTQEWSIKYVKSLSGILKIVEMVGSLWLLCRIC